MIVSASSCIDASGSISYTLKGAYAGLFTHSRNMLCELLHTLKCTKGLLIMNEHEQTICNSCFPDV